MESLAHDLLLQIHEQQVQNSQTLGRIEATMKLHIEQETPLMEKMQTDIGDLQRTKWKHAGFFGGVMLVLQPLGFAIMKRFWP